MARLLTVKLLETPHFSVSFYPFVHLDQGFNSFFFIPFFLFLMARAILPLNHMYHKLPRRVFEL